MPHRREALEEFHFSGTKRDALARVIERAAKRSQVLVQPDQIEYLLNYLADPEVDAALVVVEEPYIDRHYAEEYSGYYASSLRPPPNTATRLHFFKRGPSFTEELGRAVGGKYDDVQRALTLRYLGFSVIRPIPAVPIGRTVLVTYPTHGSSSSESERKDRHYAKQAHSVHLYGIELAIKGVPFQQQDQAVGACATTAVWSALAQVSRIDGGRAPTPLAVTQAATRSVIRNRAFPALEGLDVEQIACAVRELGYSPHYMNPHFAVTEFQLALKCYLASEIPVVLILSGTPHHAVAAVGYRETEPNGSPPPDLVFGDPNGRHIRSSGMSRVYVHDDRYGPYMRMVWAAPTMGKSIDEPAFPVLRRQDRVYGDEVRFAIAPLYPKLRLSAKDLIACATELWSVVLGIAECSDHELKVELRFVLGGKFMRDLLEDAALDTQRRVAFAQELHLPRYVGIASFSVDGAAVVDAIFDTTDIARSTPWLGNLLALVPLAVGLAPMFSDFVRRKAPHVIVCK